MRRHSRIHGSTTFIATLATALVTGLGTALSLGVVTTTAAPAYAAATDVPSRVTVMGTLMDELGCARDWDEGCFATDMTDEGTEWALEAEVPAGSYEWKVRLNGSWEESYGEDGGQSNATFALAEPARLRFSYDHLSHQIAVAPADPAEPLSRADRQLAGDSLRKDLTRERLYFVMADRFDNGDTTNDDAGLGADRLVSGYDPTDTGFYHGGDLQGVIDRLDYIQGLGTTAIWLTPSFTNKPVQGAPGSESAGYHGYWITDFTTIDPHLGTNADMARLVRLAHQRGLKVFFDIITNHTADVIAYDRSAYGADGNLPYVSTQDEPYVDASGQAFDDRDFADGTRPFPEVDLDSFPYRPEVPAGEEDAKVPAWLNDPTLYHNRGTSTFAGESNTYGDFPSGAYSSLDDLWTENPKVVRGMTEIYKTWVDEVGIDGFRIDTVKHVNTEFWQQFSPALLDHAAAQGNDDFFMFGEVYDASPEFMSRYTTEGKLQATVDFGFQGAGTGFAQGAPTTKLRDFFASDDWYTDTDSNVYETPTFLGNHDMGRIGSFLRANAAAYGEDELLKRDELAHALMYLSRGQPVVYYGDEQGFSAPRGVANGIGDQRAREDMFASQVDLYNSFDLIGNDATTADSNFDSSTPLYRSISGLAALRERYPALADGAQVHRFASDRAGIYAFSRVSADGREYVVALNNDAVTRSATIDTFAPRTTYREVYSGGASQARSGTDAGAVRSDPEGHVDLRVPALGVRVWRADRRIPRSRTAPRPAFESPTAGGLVGGRAEVGVGVPGDDFTQVTLAWRPVGAKDWQVLGTDDNAPYRVFHDVTDLPQGTLVEYRAIARDADGDLGVAQTYAKIGTPAQDGDPGTDGPVTQPDAVSVPGTFQDEVGCPTEWTPECPDIDLALDADDLVWSRTFSSPAIPAGTYAYKAAINDSWDENYGAGGAPAGDNIALAATGDPVTFWYSHQTHWVTNSIDTPHLFTAAGSFQSELGCPGDWQPDCLRSWLQDPDGDGVWTFRTTQVPAGSYELKATQDQSWAVNWGAGGVPDGPNVAFSVEAGQGVQISFDEQSKELTVSSFAAGGGGQSAPTVDLTQQRAHWLTPRLIAWDLPASVGDQWRFRLHGASDGPLVPDAESIDGGRSVALERIAGSLPPDLAAAYPHLASYDVLQVPRSAAGKPDEWLQGQLAVGAYDGLGRLKIATGLQLPGVLDRVYADAADRDLGVTWRGGRPSIAVWAPTAQRVDLVLGTGSSERRVPMRRERDGSWTVTGSREWRGSAYAFEVRVWSPDAQAVVTNTVSDPYAVALTVDSQRSVLHDLDDPSTKPSGWSSEQAPKVAQPEDRTIYELHVRDFSIGDQSVPAAERGTYLAFNRTGSAGMQHLAELADAGLNTVHLLPAFDIATIPERRADQATPDCDLPSLPPDSEQQQACVTAVAADDGFNWGYDPYHWTTPEGSYAVDPDRRTQEFRTMVRALHREGLQVVMDVVYNHTTAAGLAPLSTLDKIVPGYYHRLDADGGVTTSTCCSNTATEHLMMGKMMVDSVATWARAYHVDGFRFDLMGHHSKQNMLDVRARLDRLTQRRDGVDGTQIYLYGEGWNFGEVADDARFEQATQANMAGTGIGTFSDRLRDAVRGGGPFDDDPRIQGFGTGLATDPNASPANGTPAEQQARLAHLEDLVKLGMAGNLADFSFRATDGSTVTGRDVDYNGQPAGYAADPSETISYVDAHDNETLFDTLQLKLPVDTPMADRVRMNTVALSTVTLGQGISFWHAGVDLLRSKSLDRNSFDSGDWFNRIDWTGQENTFGSGLPPAADNEAKWGYQRPLLADPALVPGPDDMAAAHAAALDLLRIRTSSRLFRLGSADAIQAKVSFLDASSGVVAMLVDDTHGRGVDPRLDGVLVVVNASAQAAEVTGTGGGWRLHPVQQQGADPVVRTSSATAGRVTVPARTTAVFTR